VNTRGGNLEKFELASLWPVLDDDHLLAHDRAIEEDLEAQPQVWEALPQGVVNRIIDRFLLASVRYARTEQD